MSDHQDWTTVVFRKKANPANKKTSLKTAPPPSSSSTSSSTSSTTIITVPKANAASNRQREHDLARWKSVVNDDCETFRHATIDPAVARAIQQARQRKNQTQKDLALQINETLTVVQNYENKKAIPSDFVLNKLERALSIRLRGKFIGEPIAPSS